MAKLSRNGPCPCGSGKKYKRCCLGTARDPEKGEPEPSPAASGSEQRDQRQRARPAAAQPPRRTRKIRTRDESAMQGAKERFRPLWRELIELSIGFANASKGPPLLLEAARSFGFELGTDDRLSSLLSLLLILNVETDAGPWGRFRKGLAKRVAQNKKQAKLLARLQETWPEVWSVWRRGETTWGAPVAGPGAGQERPLGEVFLGGPARGPVSHVYAWPLAFEGARFLVAAVSLTAAEAAQIVEAVTPSPDDYSFWDWNSYTVLEAWLPHCLTYDPDEDYLDDDDDDDYDYDYDYDETRALDGPTRGHEVTPALLHGILGELYRSGELGEIVIRIAGIRDAESAQPVAEKLLEVRERLLRYNPWWKNYGLDGTPELTLHGVLALLGVEPDWSVPGAEAAAENARCAALGLPEAVLLKTGFDGFSPLPKLQARVADEGCQDAAVNEALARFRERARWYALSDRTRTRLTTIGRIEVLLAGLDRYHPDAATAPVAEAVPDKRVLGRLQRGLGVSKGAPFTFAEVPRSSARISACRGIGAATLDELANGLHAMLRRLEKERLAGGVPAAPVEGKAADELAAGLDALESLFS